jgi:hypothetical protein
LAAGLDQLQHEAEDEASGPERNGGADGKSGKTDKRGHWKSTFNGDIGEAAAGL